MSADDDPMYRNTAASRAAAETPVKLPDDDKTAEQTGEAQTTVNPENEPSS